MRKDIKGQISVEMLAVVGVVIVGSLIFATYYLSSVNRNIDQATDIDVDFRSYLPDDDDWDGITPIGPDNGDPDSGGPGPLVCEAGSVCSPLNSTENCTNIDPASYTGGIAICTDAPDCDWDTSNCVPIGGGGLGLLVYFNEPRISLTQNDATVGQNRSITAELEVPAGNADFSVNVRNEFNVLTNVCQIGSDVIPATEDGWDIGSYSGNQKLTRNISCSAVGIYEFNFKLDDGTIEENGILELEVTEAEPPSETVFSLCGKDSGVDVTLCINHLNNEQNPVNGVTFYVNFPNYAEHKEESPACDGNNCFYLGISS